MQSSVDTSEGATSYAALGAPLKQTQKLASIGLLALSTTHDLNNFLTCILGHVTMVRGRLRDPALLEHHLSQIETGAMRAVEMIRQLRLCADADKPTVTRVAVNGVVREMLDLLHSMIPNRARLRVDLAPGLPRVLTDASQLRQVIMNLIVNASEALSDGRGTIRVCTGTTGLSGREADLVGPTCDVKPGRYVFVEIEDDGIGMDEKTRVRIFEPFFTTKPTGSGLGLAVLRDFARGRHRAIELVTRPGEGTTFRILLRAPEAEPSSDHHEG